MTLEQLPSTGLLTSSEEVVAGTISLSGGVFSITKGSGFTGVINSTGVFTITFNTAFSDSPRVIGTVAGQGFPFVSGSPTTTSFQMATVTDAGSVFNPAGVHFIAYIPSPTKTKVPRDFGLVTTLPTSPTPQTGDLCTYTDSLTTPTYQWRLQYNSSIASNKWVCIGGTPLTGYTNATVTTTSTTYANPTGGQVTLTLPLAGDYDVWADIYQIANSAASVTYWSYSMGALVAIDDWGTYGYDTSTPNSSHGSIQYRHVGRLASDVIAEKVKVSSTTGTYKGRSIRVMPVKVG